MRLSIELNKANAIVNTDGTIDWIPALKYAAQRIQELNVVAAAALVNGPVQSNPAAPQVELFLGEVNTPPTEFGHVHVHLSNYQQMRLSAPLMMFLADAFMVIAGAAAGEIVDAEGNITAVPVGGIA